MSLALQTAKPLRLADYDFDLPESLIARYPLPERSASRLLCLNKWTGELQHRPFKDFPELLSPKDLLVFNNTQVIPARWYGNKDSGGRIELLIERLLDEHHALVHIRASKALRSGAMIQLEGNVSARVIERHADLYKLEFLDVRPILLLLDQYGHIPLPSYLERSADIIDSTRYQTVYATEKGAVAAPTAGLHFDEPLLEVIRQKQIHTAYITLHVGAGTFQPVRHEDITQHQIHAEYLQVPSEVCHLVEKTKAHGGKVVAVGTTTVRALESASQAGTIQPYIGDTRLFIYPGYSFRCVDAMITNFHLPKSSLLMLVSAFAGYANVMESYRQAITTNYRFFSYGDAMWIE